MKRAVVFVGLLVAACGPGHRDGVGDDSDAAPEVCQGPVCSPDNSAVVACDGTAQACPQDTLCSNAVCMPACEAAEKNHASIGCEYYSVDMAAADGPPKDACYTTFIANTSRGQAHFEIEFNGASIDLAMFAKIPVGSGQNLSYSAYDPAVGLAPGQVAIAFLGYAPGGIGGNVACPVPAAIGTEAQLDGTGIGHAFHITTDLPVVAYQMLPYGGGAAATTGASLLLPTSAWSTNYIAVTAYDDLDMPAEPNLPGLTVPGPSMNIVAMEDNTTITMRPTSAIKGGNGIPAGPVAQPWTMMLNKGEHAQISQWNRLSGSPITSDKKIGVFGGHEIMSIDVCCGDHGEQMLAPVQALGYEYVAAPHGDRRGAGEPRVYRIFGAVNGTQLTYDPPGIGPPTVNLGQILEIRTTTPFVVRSQGSDNPFVFFTYMTGSGQNGNGDGDPDFVRMVPPAQYMRHYVFFSDPTYPTTVLTLVRTKHNGAFADVNLECMGTVTGWQPVGNGDYEITWVRLVDHWTGMGLCNNGVNVIDSANPVGVWVWGWGSQDAIDVNGKPTGWVSYGYPAGEGVLPINDVIIE